MKKILSFLFLFIAVLSLFGCNTESNDSSNNNDKTLDQETEEATKDSDNENSLDSKSEANGLVGGEKEDIVPKTNLTITDLYDINNIIRVELNISESELSKMEADYESNSNFPAYRLCDSVIISITKDSKTYTYTYYQVGIRMKGNTSKHSFYSSNEGIYNNIHFKLSFQETFDDTYYYKVNELMTWSDDKKEEREDREFFDQSTIDFRYNKEKDQSYIKEYYALEVFRANGIISQHSNFSEVCINYGTKKLEYGLYLMTEAYKKDLIKNSLSSNTSYINMGTWKEEKNGTYGVSGSKYGQLYKASYIEGAINNYSSNLFGVEDANGYAPTFELKTNKDSIDNTLIMNAFKVISEGSYDEISEVIDLEYFAMYEAIATILGSPDDLRNNFNNYGLYFRKTDGKMIIIPLDQDRVLGIGYEWNPSGNNMVTVGALDRGRNGEYDNQTIKLYLKTILSSTDCQKAYLENIQTLLDSKYFNDDTYFNSIYSIVKSHYGNYVKGSLCNQEFSKDKTINDNITFNDYITKKSSTLCNSEKEATNYTLTIDGTTYENFALVGSMTSWKATSYYTFSYNEETNKLTLSFVIDSRKRYECKILAKVKNGDWNGWFTITDNAKLTTGSNYIFDTSDKNGKTLTLIIDISTGILTYSFA